MSLAGDGVIAIWQDLVPEAREDYYEWHSREHMPERLSIPGFRRARRFVAVVGGPEFYTLYEADSHDDVRGRAYLERLNAPTEWTRKIMPAFRNMARAVCRVAYSGGVGEGGFMLTQRFSLPCDRRQEVVARLCGSVLPLLTGLPGVYGVHLCLGDESASAVETFEKKFRDAEDLTPPYVVMIEGTSRVLVAAAGDVVARELSPLPVDSAVYQLEHALANFGCGAPARAL